MLAGVLMAASQIHLINQNQPFLHQLLLHKNQKSNVSKQMPVNQQLVINMVGYALSFIKIHFLHLQNLKKLLNVMHALLGHVFVEALVTQVPDARKIKMFAIITVKDMLTTRNTLLVNILWRSLAGVPLMTFFLYVV